MSGFYCKNPPEDLKPLLHELEDEYEILEFKGHSFALIGLADMTADETIKDSEQIRLRGERFRPVAEELPTIVLSHSPDVFFYSLQNSAV